MEDIKPAKFSAKMSDRMYSEWWISPPHMGGTLCRIPVGSKEEAIAALQVIMRPVLCDPSEFLLREMPDCDNYTIMFYDQDTECGRVYNGQGEVVCECWLTGVKFKEAPNGKVSVHPEYTWKELKE